VGSVRADASELDEEAVARWIDVAAPRSVFAGITRGVADPSSLTVIFLGDWRSGCQ